MASGQEKQGQRKKEAFLRAVSGGNLQRFGIQLARKFDAVQLAGAMLTARGTLRHAKSK